MSSKKTIKAKDDVGACLARAIMEINISMAPHCYYGPPAPVAKKFEMRTLATWTGTHWVGFGGSSSYGWWL